LSSQIRESLKNLLSQIPNSEIKNPIKNFQLEIIAMAMISSCYLLFLYFLYLYFYVFLFMYFYICSFLFMVFAFMVLCL